MNNTLNCFPKSSDKRKELEEVAHKKANCISPKNMKLVRRGDGAGGEVFETVTVCKQ